MPTAKETQALADAVFYALDDMGRDGKSCCGYTKAMLRVAYEPFRQAEIAEGVEHDEMDMPLDVARKIVDDTDAGI